ncbi:MAG: biopolymer transporter ExbD [Chthoniobacterales bacterium]|nr:biopolymer transporter ExbD [Chthoniobacterales bacterium]
MTRGFYTRKRRAPVVIIVSLIDILAILLIFFIVTTTFKKNLPQLKIALPESKTAAAAETKEEPVILEVKDEETLQLGGQPVTFDTLAVELRRMNEANPGKGIALQADEGVPFRVIVRVIDALRDAGIRNLPAFARPPGEGQ